VGALTVAAPCAAGGAGAGTRWWVERRLGARGTLLVNVVGSFIAGLVVSSSPDTRAVVGVGWCGGLTTFSGWALTAGSRPRSATLHVAACLAAAALGLALRR
jgi:fluoride ion exporter CrcB/FEX